MDRSFGFGHERLGAYWDAREFLGRVADLLASLPRGESGIADQLKRAGDSVFLNLCEGAGRRAGKEKAHFYEISRGGRGGRERAVPRPRRAPRGQPPAPTRPATSGTSTGTRTSTDLPVRIAGVGSPAPSESAPTSRPIGDVAIVGAGINAALGVRQDSTVSGLTRVRAGFVLAAAGASVLGVLVVIASVLDVLYGGPPPRTLGDQPWTLLVVVWAAAAGNAGAWLFVTLRREE